MRRKTLDVTYFKTLEELVMYLKRVWSKLEELKKTRQVTIDITSSDNLWFIEIKG